MDSSAAPLIYMFCWIICIYNCDVLNDEIVAVEIVSVIHELANGKQPGADGLSYDFFKNSYDLIINEMCVLFNTILQSGKFPRQWSDAIISPLHKKGPRSDVKNYRGISLLCCFSNRLSKWSEENDKLDESQGAY